MKTYDINAIASRFNLGIEVSEISPLGEGFINDTFIIKDSSGPRYILQRKNHIVFPDVPGMMDNIAKVTGHIRSKGGVTLKVAESGNGKLFWQDEEGNYWAVCEYIGNSVCYDKADSVSLARKGGEGLGIFHRMVSDFDQPLVEVIKGFHNIRHRFNQWDESVRRDAAGRVASLSEEISWIESRRSRMLSFWSEYESGLIPTRVIHGDTKLSNFLFDAKTGDCLCAIDLDTMMSSTVLCDTGDALRAYTNTGAEDDKDTGKVSMSMDYFKAYIGGYLSEMKDYLSPSEIKYLAFSGVYITFEQVLRFLMDYIDGDTYYKIAYPQHNLVRTRAQYALLCSMENQLPQMNEFVSRECGMSAE
ncbi:MAG: aminoglycoside phosphotransferase family protein [Bacteroidales bacterium]|nr:aminoglycoside phosphotransferase family protein [Candidatus Cacconaster merdequi]